MKHKFWVTAFDGNNWLSYSTHDTYAEAETMVNAVKANTKIITSLRISLLLVEVEGS